MKKPALRESTDLSVSPMVTREETTKPSFRNTCHSRGSIKSTILNSVILSGRKKATTRTSIHSGLLILLNITSVLAQASALKTS